MVTFCIEPGGDFFYVQEIECIEDLNTTLYKGNRIRYEVFYYNPKGVLQYDTNSIMCTRTIVKED